MKVLPSGIVMGITAAVLVCAGTVCAQGTEADRPAAAAATVPLPKGQDLPEDEPGMSQVRIVRLSQVHGVVKLDRNTGRGFEGAFPNIPVVRGAKLLTGEGVAEVEFEDNSTLRLAPETVVHFDQLSRMVSGDTVSTVHILKGTAYVSLAKTRGTLFTLSDGGARIVLSPGAHVRLDATDPQATLTVFEGDARLESEGGVAAVTKRQSLLFNPAAQTPPRVVRQADAGPLDDWDAQQTSYHKRVASFAGAGNSNTLYGSSDLSYYGQFVDMPGCGSMWRPYFASAAWDPFANGVWAWYPSAGYSWVSPYPWAWLPFHSGSWAMCGAGGWGWRPGGQWYGLQNTAIQKIAHYPLPRRIPPDPVRGAATLVPVNGKPLTLSGPAGAETFVFRQDSAGLGVPRETFGRLNAASSSVEHRGSASTSLPSSTAVVDLTSAAMPNSVRGSLGNLGRASVSPSLSSSMRSSSSVSAAMPNSAPSVSSGAAAGAKH